MSDVITIKEIEYISEQDAADYIGYNVWSLQMWRYRNKPWRPPHYRIGGRVRYRITDLDAWVASARREVTAA